MAKRTPSSVMYQDFKSFGHIKNHEAALLLLAKHAVGDNQQPSLMRIADRSFLSRKIVHAEPGAYPQEAFEDFWASSQEIMTRILENIAIRERSGTSNRATVIRHYESTAARQMAQALDENGLDGRTYINAVQRIALANFVSMNDRLHTLLLLYVATGCLGNPGAAIAILNDCLIGKLHLQTGEALPAYVKSQEILSYNRKNVNMGLLRLVRGLPRPPIYSLSTGSNGTVLGALPLDEASITDVGADVSPRHARIWRDQHGTWWCQDLGSLYGTTVSTSHTCETSSVPEGTCMVTLKVSDEPMRLKDGDILTLASSTHFLAMRIAE